MSGYIKTILRFKKYILVLLIALIILLIFRSIASALLLLSATIALSFIASKLKLKYAGVELVTFTVVLLGIAYGPITGIIAGILLETIHLLLSKRGFKIYNVWVIPCFGFVGFLAGNFATVNILMLGVGLTLFLHAVHFLLGFFVLKTQKVRYAIYAISNIILNVLLFANLGAVVLHML